MQAMTMYNLVLDKIPMSSELSDPTSLEASTSTTRCNKDKTKLKKYSLHYPNVQLFVLAGIQLILNEEYTKNIPMVLSTIFLWVLHHHNLFTYNLFDHLTLHLIYFKTPAFLGPRLRIDRLELQIKNFNRLIKDDTFFEQRSK